MALGSTQHLTEMSTANIRGGGGGADCLEHVGAPTSHNLHSMLQG
jgi:hypothetical protein